MFHYGKRSPSLFWFELLHHTFWGWTIVHFLFICFQTNKMGLYIKNAVFRSQTYFFMQGIRFHLQNEMTTLNRFLWTPSQDWDWASCRLLQLVEFIFSLSTQIVFSYSKEMFPYWAQNSISSQKRNKIRKNCLCLMRKNRQNYSD